VLAESSVAVVHQLRYCKIRGILGTKPPDSFDVLKKRQGTPGPAQFWESEVKSLGGKTDR
jgi:hypothetical protein